MRLRAVLLALTMALPAQAQVVLKTYYAEDLVKTPGLLEVSPGFTTVIDFWDTVDAAFSAKRELLRLEGGGSRLLLSTGMMGTQTGAVPVKSGMTDLVVEVGGEDPPLHGAHRAGGVPEAVPGAPQADPGGDLRPSLPDSFHSHGGACPKLLPRSFSHPQPSGSGPGGALHHHRGGPFRGGGEGERLLHPGEPGKPPRELRPQRSPDPAGGEAPPV